MRTPVIILLLRTCLFLSTSDGKHRGEIFMGYRGKRAEFAGADDESLNSTVSGNPRGDVGEIQSKTTTTTERPVSQTAVSEDDAVGNQPSDGESGIKFVENANGIKHGPFRILASLFEKATSFIDYLSHPNVPLTPFVLLSKLKQKFYQHLRHKLNPSAYHEDYPFAYKFGNM